MERARNAGVTATELPVQGSHGIRQSLPGVAAIAVALSDRSEAL